MISLRDRVNHIVDNETVTRLRFLDEHDQEVIKGVMKYVPNISLSGGYFNAERKRALFYTQEEMITAYKIIPSYKDFELTHQNILGSLMGLNIERDTIGDIIPSLQIFFVISELKEEIDRSFLTIGNVPIKLEEVDLNDIVYEKEYLELKTTVSSMRVDNVIAKMMKKSRNDALNHIKKEYVKVNHEVIIKGTKEIVDNDIISLRYYGRFQIIDCNQLSKKGKYIVLYRKFV